MTHDGERRWLSSRLIEALFLVQIVANIVALCLVVGLQFYLIIQSNEQVVAQNDSQLCAQHDILLAVRQTNRSLGLPTEDIRLPDIEGLDCP